MNCLINDKHIIISYMLQIYYMDTMLFLKQTYNAHYHM